MTTPRKTKAKPQPQPWTLARTALATGVAAIGLGATVLALLRRTKSDPAEHAAPDLALGKPRPGPADRAPQAFRPDPTAIPTAEERESLRPATGPSPSMVADRGELAGQGAPANG